MIRKETSTAISPRGDSFSHILHIIQEILSCFDRVESIFSWHQIIFVATQCVLLELKSLRSLIISKMLLERDSRFYELLAGVMNAMYTHEQTREQEKGQRNYSLDNIRAIAIILVVLGHSIIIYSSDWNIYTSMVSAPELDYLKKVINLVQMPLFFSLSGFLFGHSGTKYSLRVFAIRKLKRLLVPYFLIAALWMLPIKCFIRYKDYTFMKLPTIFINDILLGKDTGHLWFLPCLFVCLLVLFLLHRMMEGRLSHQVSLLIGLIILSIFSGKINYFHIQLLTNVCKYFIWVYVGFLVFQYYADIRTFFTNHKLFSLASVVALIAVVAVQILRVRMLAIPCSLLSCLLAYGLVPNRENHLLS